MGHRAGTGAEDQVCRHQRQGDRAAQERRRKARQIRRVAGKNQRNLRLSEVVPGGQCASGHGRRRAAHRAREVEGRGARSQSAEDHQRHRGQGAKDPRQPEGHRRGARGRHQAAREGRQDSAEHGGRVERNARQILRGARARDDRPLRARLRSRQAVRREGSDGHQGGAAPRLLHRPARQHEDEALPDQPRERHEDRSTLRLSQRHVQAGAAGLDRRAAAEHRQPPVVSAGASSKPE